MTRLATLLLAISLIASVCKAGAGESVDYLYRLHCSGCHGLDGEGSKIGRIPPFAGIVGHLAGTPDGRLYLVHVPGVANAALPDAETAELLNYVLRTWGGRELPPGTEDFKREEVQRLRSVHLDDVAALRQKLAAELAERSISIAY